MDYNATHGISKNLTLHLQHGEELLPETENILTEATDVLEAAQDQEIDITIRGENILAVIATMHTLRFPMEDRLLAIKEGRMTVTDQEKQALRDQYLRFAQVEKLAVKRAFELYYDCTVDMI